MGIALGSFAAIRFRSDVAADSGDHAAQFLGTAVVRTYRTEKCGIKGMRLLVHPSLEPLLIKGNPGGPPSLTDEHQSFRFLEVPNTELANDPQVRYELDYWDLATTKERDAWHALQDMWDVAPSIARQHYEATAQAIDRMRVVQGESPLKNFRRRTPPRRPR
jgi:hypothetical protein